MHLNQGLAAERGRRLEINSLFVGSEKDTEHSRHLRVRVQIHRGTKLTRTRAQSAANGSSLFFFPSQSLPLAATKKTFRRTFRSVPPHSHFLDNEVQLWNSYLLLPFGVVKVQKCPVQLKSWEKKMWESAIALRSHTDKNLELSFSGNRAGRTWPSCRTVVLFLCRRTDF